MHSHKIVYSAPVQIYYTCAFTAWKNVGLHWAIIIWSNYGIFGVINSSNKDVTGFSIYFEQKKKKTLLSIKSSVIRGDTMCVEYIVDSV